MFQLYADSHYIEKFTIYGERHSGTNFLEQCIKSEFGLDITYFYGHKHFFGFNKPETIRYKNRGVLFFGIVRDPYNWLSAFYNAPHHVPQQNRFNFTSFLTNEWYSVKLNGDEILDDRNFNTQPNPIRYKNIFELRKTKYEYLVDILPFVAQNYVLLRYEDFIRNHRKYLGIIQDRFRLKKIGNAPDAFVKRNIEVNDLEKSIIDSNLDWSVEETLGYYQR